MGMTGDYGMPDYDKAFRPLPKHEAFWRHGGGRAGGPRGRG